VPDPDLQERQEFNRELAEEFRANGGRILTGRLAGRPLLLLTTTGARTGQPRMTPLGYITYGDKWVVFAANAGRPVRPGWYHNLLAHPEATIEVGTETIPVVAELAKEPELSELWARVMMVAPFVAIFQETAPGPIPVFVLTRKTT
jgi:deazaflavin-dependent oxidoreductase (nitroreductase family)